MIEEIVFLSENCHIQCLQKDDFIFNIAFYLELSMSASSTPFTICVKQVPMAMNSCFYLTNDLFFSFSDLFTLPIEHSIASQNCLLRSSSLVWTLSETKQGVSKFISFSSRFLTLSSSLAIDLTISQIYLMRFNHERIPSYIFPTQWLL